MPTSKSTTDDVQIQRWAGNAILVALVSGIVVLFAFLNDFSLAIRGPSASPTIEMWTAFFGSAMGVNAGLLVSIAVVATSIASRIRTKSHVIRWLYFIGFLYVTDWTLLALLESHQALLSLSFASEAFLYRAASVSFSAWIQGFIMVAAGVAFAFAPETKWVWPWERLKKAD